MRLARCSVLFALAVNLACSHRSPYPSTESPLALKRVVLYRSGIGYFERHGDVDGDQLRLKVRRDQINDLLKSLTVIDRNTGKAVSVSMPLDPDSWASSVLQEMPDGAGGLAGLLNGLRGSEVTLYAADFRVTGRIVMVEEIIDEPEPEDRRTPRNVHGFLGPRQRDHKVTLAQGDRLRVVRLSEVRTIALKDGALALQLHRRLDASSGEGMFQQVEVSIRLAGKSKHDLAVSYVVAAPVWKPTYRVVLPEQGKGKGLLQGWAVVDNTSGEDWSDVRLALTAGEPIAFQYDLHTPREVDRVDLTEEGVRKRARVAVGETTFAQDEVEEEPAVGDDDLAEAAPEEPSMAGGADVAANKKEKRATRDASKGAGSPPAAAPSPESKPMPPPSAPAMDYAALQRSTLASAQAHRVSGLTRYDLSDPVTVPNGSSTMVAIINVPVEAEETFLFKPGGAGVGYDSNPYRVVRFKNTSPFVLEPGPISVYAGGSFVGEGLSETVGRNTSATIPFAVEPTIMVLSRVERSGDQMHLLRIVRGVIEVETFARTTTQWTVKGNKRPQPYKVLVRHPKAGWNYRIVDRAAGVEELTDGYLVPIHVPAQRSEASVTVVEQTPSKMSLSIWDRRVPGLLDELMASTDLSRSMRQQLEPVVALRREIGRIDTEIDGLKRQRQELDQRASETRQSLEALKKDPNAGALRKRLGQRLEEFVSEADRLGRRVVELESQRLDKKIQLEDLLQNLELERDSKSRGSPTEAGKPAGTPGKSPLPPTPSAPATGSPKSR